VAIDQPDFDYLSLKLCLAWHGLDAGGEADHLIDPRPPFCRAEIAADSPANVIRLADVKHMACLIMFGNEQIDPWFLR